MSAATLEARPAFAQSVDVERPHELLTENARRSGTLVYRYTDTGEMVTVPNVPYNQPATTRVEVMRYHADQEVEKAGRMQKYPSVGVSPERTAVLVERLMARAAQIRREAARIEQADREGHPVAASHLPVDYGPNVGF